MTKQQDKEKSHKDAKHFQFTGKGSVEGRVPIPVLEEITIQGAREVLERKDGTEKVKSYKCKVIGTDTHIIIRRKNVVGSGSKEIALACTDIFRFFIFAKDPRLVILVVPDKPDGSRAYLLLKMQDEKQANQVCNIIQMGRKNLLKSPDLKNGVTSQNSQFKEAVASAYGESKDEIEMRENNVLAGRSSESSENTSDEEDVDDILHNIQSNNDDYVSKSKLIIENNNSVVTKTEENSKLSKTFTQSKISCSESVTEKNMIVTEDGHKIIVPVESIHVQSSAPSKYLSDDFGSDQSQQSLLRQSPPDPCRRAAPITEEMTIESPEFNQSKPVPTNRTKEELKAALLRDLYNDDWAVDFRIVKDFGRLGSRLSESGDVFLFTAHHLVAEPNTYMFCTTGDDKTSPDINCK